MKSVVETEKRRVERARELDHVDGIIGVEGESVLDPVVEVLVCEENAIRWSVPEDGRR